MGDDTTDLIIIILFIIFIPPLAIWWKTKEIGLDFVICLLIWLLCCGIGGSIYAIWKCFLCD